MICLLYVDSVNAHLMADSVLALYCIRVNHNIADDSVDGSYHFRLWDSNGRNLCFVRWVPNILTNANHLGYFKEAVGRNLPRAVGQLELDKLNISKSP
jgi:hypothetical protein